jgi:AcrR family transcriptional regulator
MAMPVRDAEATRQRLLDAARAEFAEHGIAGARVDRIADSAQANKAQIYHYFGSKDRLFDAVWEELVKQIVAAAPVDVDDLAGFAARLSETYAENPDLIRLITWEQLERGGDPPHTYAVESTQGNVDAIAKAQAEGRVSDRFDAPVLFALIIHIAALWGMTSPDVLAVVNLTGAEQRRQIVQQAVATLLA